MSRRVAVVVSHPIQHFCPQYSSWARIEGLELKVFFASRKGLDPYIDKDFGRSIQWEQMVLDFAHEFLPQVGRELFSADFGAIAGRLSAFSPDVVVVYGYAQPLQRKAIAWARNHAIPLAMIADSELRAHRGLIKRVVKSFTLPLILSKVDVFLTVGDANESYYRRYGVEDRKLVRCSFPIDVKSLDAAVARRSEHRARLRNELGIPFDHVIVLMVGKLVQWKRQGDLVRFSNSIQGRSLGVTVVLAGTGPEEQELRSVAMKTGPGGVVFAGFVPPSKLVEYYAAADVYAHCSEAEPHSLAISEAIYSGLPVVISDRCGSYGPSDDVRPGLNGLVYECGSIKAMSSALMNLINHEARRKTMGAASAEIARANQSLAHGRALLQAMELITFDRGQ